MMEVEAASKRRFNRDRNDRETVEEIRERERVLIRLKTLEDYEADIDSNDGNSLTFLSQLLTSDAATVEPRTATSGESA